MKQSLSLRKKLIILMTLLVIFQNIALSTALSISRVFYKLDEESFQVFNNVSHSKKQAFNLEIGQLIMNISEEARNLSKSFQNISKNAIDPSTKYYNMADIGANHLIHLLQNNSISGVFFILNNTKEDKKPSVYIRNSTPNITKSKPENFLLEVGPISISEKFSIPTTENWTIDFPLNLKDNKLDFYNKPIEAAHNFPHAEIERYGYWTNPTSILPDSQPVICYSLPLFDKNNTAIGVIGVEISLKHFTQYYLPLIDLPYQDSFYIVTPMKNQHLSMDWIISSNPFAQSYLPAKKELILKPTDISENAFTSKIQDLGEVYCFVYPLTIYSKNSPFYDNGWALVSFTPRNVLRENSNNVRTILYLSIIITTIISIIAIFFLSYFSTRTITGLSKYIASLTPFQRIHFEKTNMKEIDELTSAIEKLNKSVVQAYNTTSQILELSLLPIGGYEVNTLSHQVILTKYIYELLNIAPGSYISEPEWNNYYQNFLQSPALEYENIYKFSKKHSSENLWLRIIEKTTETSKIGVVLDVTKEIEEHHRLIHELDYDNMTNLYNRRAFKREVYSKIKNEPNKIGAMIFSDLDNLKYTNDTFGHEIGDYLILKASEMFNQFSYHGGIVARISGDEFATYIHGFSSKKEARKFIHEQFKKHKNYILKTPDGVSNRIRSSSGLAWYPDDSQNVMDLLKLSDYAMYDAKHTEKGALFEFDSESYHNNAYLLENREAIRKLIDEQLIHFCFQPIISLHTGKIFAYEALMRSSLKNFKSPLEVLSVASSQSQLGQLERLVLSSAFEKIDQSKEDLENINIFVNSIPSHLLSPEEFDVLREKYGHLFSKVVLEVTERESDTLESMNDRLDAIRNSGIRLAIDDFGNGYSGEVRILSIRPNIVKIDMELIQGIHKSKDKQKLVANLISFCHPKHILVIAEGVEEKEDLITIMKLNVDLVQGFYTGKPALTFEPIRPDIKAEILNLRQELMSETNIWL